MENNIKFEQILNLAEELIKLDSSKGIELKKQILLEECKRRFPIGTKIKDLYYDIRNNIVINENNISVIKKELRWESNLGVIGISHYGISYVYVGDKFAEILEYPLFKDNNGKFWYKSDFKEDDIFVVTYKNKHDYLFRFKKLMDNKIICKTYIFIGDDYFNDFEQPLISYEGISNIRKPTQEEISWLEKCEKADKFVPKDYSFQDTIKEQTVRVERNDSKCEISIKANNPVLQDYNTIQLLNIAKDVVNLGENYRYEQELLKLKEKYGINE